MTKRIRTPEYYARKKQQQALPESKAKRREWSARYRKTPKFAETRRKYNESDDGKLTMLEYQRKRRYGMKPGEWNAMFLTQGSRCAICLTSEHGGRNWHTDHCHSTNIVRGIVCHNCNHMLGGAKDNLQTLKAAIAYLKRHDAQLRK